MKAAGHVGTLIAGGVREVLPVMMIAVLCAVVIPRTEAAENAGANPSKADVTGEWQNLFDGRTVAGWKQSGFEGEANVKVENPFRDRRGAIIIEAGTTLSGITWT